MAKYAMRNIYNFISVLSVLKNRIISINITGAVVEYW